MSCLFHLTVSTISLGDATRSLVNAYLNFLTYNKSNVKNAYIRNLSRIHLILTSIPVHIYLVNVAVRLTINASFVAPWLFHIRDSSSIQHISNLHSPVNLIRIYNNNVYNHIVAYFNIFSNQNLIILRYLRIIREYSRNSS